MNSRFPEQASTIARSVDMLYFALTTLSGVKMLLDLSTILYFCFKYGAAKRRTAVRRACRR